MILYKAGDTPSIQDLRPQQPFDVVIGMSGIESLTARMVGQVHEAWSRNTALYDRIFQDIDALSLQGAEAVQRGDFAQLGELMNINHGLLNALQVSTPELEDMVGIARRAGALGAKLTGGGGGGSMVALCPDQPEAVRAALEGAGYRTMVSRIGSEPT